MSECSTWNTFAHCSWPAYSIKLLVELQADGRLRSRRLSPVSTIFGAITRGPVNQESGSGTSLRRPLPALRPLI